MRRCIYWFYMGFCALLNDCKCNKKDKTIDECDPFKYTL